MYWSVGRILSCYCSRDSPLSHSPSSTHHRVTAQIPEHREGAAGTWTPAVREHVRDPSKSSCRLSWKDGSPWSAGAHLGNWQFLLTSSKGPSASFKCVLLRGWTHLSWCLDPAWCHHCLPDCTGSLPWRAPQLRACAKRGCYACFNPPLSTEHWLSSVSGWETLDWLLISQR